MKTRKAWLIALFVAVLACNGFAVDRFWIGGAGNWSETAHWSASSGGAGGQTVPDNTAHAKFDGNSGAGNCTVDVAATVHDLTIDAAYPGTLVLGANDFTLFDGNWTVSGPAALQPGSGKVIFHSISTDDACPTITGSHALNNVRFHASGGGATRINVAAATTLTVTGKLEMTEANLARVYFNGGTVAAQGDIEVCEKDHSNLTAATGTLLINGTGNQTLNGGGSTGGQLGLVTIDKPSGTLTLANTIGFRRSVTHLAGTVDPGTSKAMLYAHKDQPLAVTSAVGLVFWDMDILQTGGNGVHYYIDFNSPVVVSNDLAFTSSYPGQRLRGHDLEVHGDVYLNDDNNRNSAAALKLAGSGVQTITSSGGYPPQLKIDKTGGEVLLGTDLTADTVDYNQELIVTRGTLNVSSNTLTVTKSGAADGDFFMDGDDTGLSVTLIDDSPLIVVQGDTKVDGTLTVTVDPGYSPAPADKITILTSGTAVTGEFDVKAGDYKYDVLYNDGGNNIKLTNIRKVTGTVFMFH